MIKTLIFKNINEGIKKKVFINMTECDINRKPRSQVRYRIGKNSELSSFY